MSKVVEMTALMFPEESCQAFLDEDCDALKPFLQDCEAVAVPMDAIISTARKEEA